MRNKFLSKSDSVLHNVFVIACPLPRPKSPWFRSGDFSAELWLRWTHRFVMSFFVFIFHSVKFCLWWWLLVTFINLCLSIISIYRSRWLSSQWVLLSRVEGCDTFLVNIWRLKANSLLALWVLKDNGLKRESPVGGVFDFNFTDKAELELTLLSCPFFVLRWKRFEFHYNRACNPFLWSGYEMEY